VAAFSLFEAVYLAQRKRIVLTLPIADWLDLLLREPSVEIIPISKSIAVSSTNLPVNFHGDPGDRLIAATAIDQELTLCTHDRALLRFGEQGLYQTLEV
jgi:PIN domain nuclease of toxin-antitoxin system